MVSDLVGVVDDEAGHMVTVSADGPQIVMQTGTDNWLTFNIRQVSQLIYHLETARAEAQLAEAQHDEATDE